MGNPVETIGEGNVARPGHQKTEGNGLRVAVGERFIGGVGKQEFPPVGREVRERSRPSAQLLGHLFAEEAAKAGRGCGELLR